MFKNFMPENQGVKLPYFDDVRSSDGWEGHTTSKSIDRLIAEIQNNVALLGYVFVSCQKGMFGDRYGFQVHFAIRAAGGNLLPARLDIACLPLKPKRLRRREKDTRVEGTQKMALYMTSKAIKGMYFLSVLSPSFVPFMSLMLADNKGQTIGDLWVANGSLLSLMPPKDSKFDPNDIVDGVTS